MATADVSLTAAPALVAAAGDDFTAWFPVAVRYAVVATETAPTVKGTKVPRGSDGYALTREVAREGVRLYVGRAAEQRHDWISDEVMSSPFNVFHPFDIFRSPTLGGSSAPVVAISATGLATVTCRPIPAPRVAISATGLATVSCANG